MKITRMQCNTCGSDLDIEEDLSFVFCKYCGAKNFVDTENKTLQKIKVMETSYRQEQTMFDKKAEHEIRKEKQDFMHAMIPIAVLLGFSFIMMFIGFGMTSCDEKRKTIQ